MADEVFVEVRVVGGGAEFDDGVVGLVGLDDDLRVLVTAVGATDDLGEELEGAFFATEVGEGEAGIGLDDTEGSEFGQVEAFGNHLGADDDVDMAGFDCVVGVDEGFLGLRVGVEAGDFGIWKKFIQFSFEKFGAEALVEDVGVVAVGAVGGNWGGLTAGVAE